MSRGNQENYYLDAETGEDDFDTSSDAENDERFYRIQDYILTCIIYALSFLIAFVIIKGLIALFCTKYTCTPKIYQ